MMNLGKLEKINNLREVWPHEAKDFTPWLAEEDNIALLSEAIDVELEVDEVESPVGGFSLDIFASEVGTDRKVIIENQLEDTNHDHLGKVLTYAAGKDAEVIVWLVKNAREEHRQAIEWLNNHTDEEIGFFLVEIELWKINDSEPAVKFNVVERPNEWAKSIKKTDAAFNDTKLLKLEYWTCFNEFAFKYDKFAKIFKIKKPSAHSWYDLSIGSSDFHISFTLNTLKECIGVEIYINDNKELFDKMVEDKDKIEEEMNVKLEWNRLENRKAARIIVKKDVDLRNKSNWNEQFQWFMDIALLMNTAFKSYV